MRHMVAKSRASLSVEEQVSSSENSRFRQPICQFCVTGRERWIRGWFDLWENQKSGVAETRSNGEDEMEEERLF